MCVLYDEYLKETNNFMKFLQAFILKYAESKHICNVQVQYSDSFVGNYPYSSFQTCLYVLEMYCMHGFFIL